MTAKTRPAMTLNPSKQSEIDFLCAVAEEVPAGSYLASFLRPAALQWFEQQARSDASCDLYGALLHEQKERTQTAANWRAEHEAANAAWKQKLEKVEKDAMTAKAEKARCEEQVLAVETTLDGVRDTCAGVIQQRDQLLRENLSAFSDLDDALIQVRDLKAKILDLLVASGTVAL